MIKVKVLDIINSVETLKSIIQLPVKAKTAYQIARLAREIEKEYNLFDQRRMELVKKYGDKDENGELIVVDGKWTVSQKNMKFFNDEINELYDSDIEINAEKINLDDLTCDLNAQQMANIMNFIKE